MQHRRASDQSSLMDERRRNGATEGHSSFIAQVKMRLKKEKPNWKENNKASSSSLRFVPHRPYSCDVETLASQQVSANFRQPYFYYQPSNAPRTLQRWAFPTLTSRKMNSSFQKLTSVVDDEESERSRPPMAPEEDFGLSCSPEERQLASRENFSTTHDEERMNFSKRVDDHLLDAASRHPLDCRHSAPTACENSRVSGFQFSGKLEKSPSSDTRPFPICHEDRDRLNYSNRSSTHETVVSEPSSTHWRKREAANKAGCSELPRTQRAIVPIDRLQQQRLCVASVAGREQPVSHQQPYTANSLSVPHELKLEAATSRRSKCQNVIVSVTSFDDNLTPVASLSASYQAGDRYPYQRSSSARSPEREQKHERSPRGSLRRGKAVDLSSYDHHQERITACSSASNSPIKESQKSSGTSKRSSIFRRLIGQSGSKNGSAEDSNSSPPSCATPTTNTMTSSLTCPTSSGGRAVSSAGLAVSTVCPEATSSVRSDFSSDSSDFKYEERIRKRIFAHYDCVSICADVRPLLNGTSRLKEGNSNTATGASQASKPFLVSAGASNLEAGLLSPEDASSTTTYDQQHCAGKSNEILLSCPYFINEIGGEPIRHVSLSRDTYSAQSRQKRNSTISCTCPSCTNPYDPYDPSSTSTCLSEFRPQAIDGNAETWHRSETAAEASVLENLSNVYLGGRLCAKRQPQLVIEHVDQGAFYYRHCFSGRAHQNYFGIEESLGPVAISAIRDKMETSDSRRFGLISPYLYRLIIRLSDLTTFRGAILEESLPSYLSAKESREQQIAGQSLQCSSGPMTPGAGPASFGGFSASSGAGIGVAAGGSARGKIPMKELLNLAIPELQVSCLRLAVPVPRTEELLLKLDEQAVYTRYKVGILYCRAEQSTEEEMYNNEIAGPAFDEFLDMLGQRVRLKGFDKYKGGLDCKGDTTGSNSLYASHQQYELMFHVSTMLPYTPQNRQQLSRKRHIGNDIVTVVFQEPGALPFSPQTVRSHFQHVFIVIRAHKPNTDNVRYSVAVSRYKDVPRFGPPILPGATFPKSKDFRDFLLTKIINAENAVHKSEKFATMAARTRREFMRDLAEHHTTSHTLDGGASGKIASILLGSSTKRKDRPKPKLYLEAFVRGAIVWEVQVLTQVEDFSLCRPIECYLGISADNLVLIEQSTQEALFCTPAHSIIGWTSHGNSLKLYYDHADVIILRTLDDEDSCEMQEILKRLQAVSKGCETIEMILRRSPTGQLGFHIQHEGIVSDVEMYGFAWQAGLRQGSRIVEICKVSIATLTYERVMDLLRTSVNLRVLVVPPLLEDGSPRRGCEDPYCSAVLGDDWPLAQTGPSFSSSRPSFDSPTGATAHRQVQTSIEDTNPTATLEGHAPGMLSGCETISRRAVANNLVVQHQAISRLRADHEGEHGHDFQTSDATDYGYESGPTSAANYYASKSLDDVQNRRDRRHSEDVLCTSTDMASLQAIAARRYRPIATRTATTIPTERWYANDMMEQRSGVDEGNVLSTTGKRTDTLSSNGSTASSEVSSDMTINTMNRKLTRPSELKRKVDRANSDMLQRVQAVASFLERTSTDPMSGDVRNPPRAPHLQPKNYTNQRYNSSTLSGAATIERVPSSGSGVSGRSSPLSMSSGHLHVPASKQRSSSSSSSVQENLIRLINDLECTGDIEEAIVISTALQHLSDNTAGQRLGAGPVQNARSRTTQGHHRSPEKERGAEWSNLVNAAARAIEGLTHRSASTSSNGSPELSGYRLRLQAAVQRVKLLEEKVDRVQAELDAERESKRNMEIEVLRLRDINKRLEEECTHAKMELKKFTEWFFEAVENSASADETCEGGLPANYASTIPFVDDAEKKN